MERLLLETDAPDGLPSGEGVRAVPGRHAAGQTSSPLNHPANIRPACWLFPLMIAASISACVNLHQEPASCWLVDSSADICLGCRTVLAVVANATGREHHVLADAAFQNAATVFKVQV